MKDIKTEITKALESKTLVKILEAIGVIIIALILFSAGVVVGFHKATFGRDWGEHYSENFGIGRSRGQQAGNMDKLGMFDYFPNAHGAVGKIIKVELPNIIVQDKDNTEKVISLGADTKIQNGRNILTNADLKIDDFVVVIGSPNAQGIIEAKLIRVVPNPELLK